MRKFIIYLPDANPSRGGWRSANQIDADDTSDNMDAHRPPLANGMPDRGPRYRPRRAYKPRGENIRYYDYED